jgi:acyl carrier protein
MGSDTEAIRQFISARLSKSGSRQLQDADDVLAMGLIDSLEIMNLITFLEQTFGISIHDGDLQPENFTSVATIATLVTRKKRL